MLFALIFAVVDKKNDNKPSPGLAPLIIGFIVFLIGMTFGFNCGYAINPARDLGLEYSPPWLDGEAKYSRKRLYYTELTFYTG
jgi:glycerol uptake facilitator-like aquaporin